MRSRSKVHKNIQIYIINDIRIIDLYYILLLFSKQKRKTALTARAMLESSSIIPFPNHTHIISLNIFLTHSFLKGKNKAGYLFCRGTIQFPVTQCM